MADESTLNILLRKSSFSTSSSTSLAPNHTRVTSVLSSSTTYEQTTIRDIVSRFKKVKWSLPTQSKNFKMDSDDESEEENEYFMEAPKSGLFQREEILQPMFLPTKYEDEPSDAQLPHELEVQLEEYVEAWREIVYCADSKLLEIYRNHQKSQHELLKYQLSHQQHRPTLSKKRNTKKAKEEPIQGISSTEPKTHWGLTFDSNFEGGNLFQVESVVRKGLPLGSPEEYDLFLQCDTPCSPLLGSNMSDWYLFRVQNVKKRKYRFNIHFFSNNNSPYMKGMRPLMISEHDFEKNSKGWQRVGYNVSYTRCTRKPLMSVRSLNIDRFMTLSFTFKSEESKNTLYFANAVPYSFTQLQNMISMLLKNSLSQQHLQAAMLCRSLAGNRCDMLVITENNSFIRPNYREVIFEDSVSSELQVREDFVTGYNLQSILPLPKRQKLKQVQSTTMHDDDVNKDETNEAKERPSDDCQLPKFLLNLKKELDFEMQQNRKQQIERARKSAVVIASRVHPGDSSASWMCEGVVKFLLSSSPEAQSLREQFVFYIIPMINPDGVINGFSKNCISGYDLNTQWQKPDKRIHPTLYYTKELLKNLENTTNLAGFFELNGSHSKEGIYCYSMLRDKVVSGTENAAKLKEYNPHKVDPRVFFRNLAMRSEFMSIKDCSLVSDPKAQFCARYNILYSFNINLSVTVNASLMKPRGFMGYVSCLSPSDYALFGSQLCLSIVDSFTKTKDKDGAVDVPSNVAEDQKNREKTRNVIKNKVTRASFKIGSTDIDEQLFHSISAGEGTSSASSLASFPKRVAGMEDGVDVLLDQFTSVDGVNEDAWEVTFSDSFDDELVDPVKRAPVIVQSGDAIEQSKVPLLRRAEFLGLLAGSETISNAQDMSEILLAKKRGKETEKVYRMAASFSSFHPITVLNYKRPVDAQPASASVDVSLLEMPSAPVTEVKTESLNEERKPMKPKQKKKPIEAKFTNISESSDKLQESPNDSSSASTSQPHARVLQLRNDRHSPIQSLETKVKSVNKTSASPEIPLFDDSQSVVFKSVGVMTDPVDSLLYSSSPERKTIVNNVLSPSLYPTSDIISYSSMEMPSFSPGKVRRQSLISFSDADVGNNEAKAAITVSSETVVVPSTKPASPSFDITFVPHVTLCEGSSDISQQRESKEELPPVASSLLAVVTTEPFFEREKNTLSMVAAQSPPGHTQSPKSNKRRVNFTDTAEVSSSQDMHNRRDAFAVYVDDVLQATTSNMSLARKNPLLLKDYEVLGALSIPQHEAESLSAEDKALLHALQYVNYVFLATEKSPSPTKETTFNKDDSVVTDTLRDGHTETKREVEVHVEQESHVRIEYADCDDQKSDKKRKSQKGRRELNPEGHYVRYGVTVDDSQQNSKLHNANNINSSSSGAGKQIEFKWPRYSDPQRLKETEEAMKRSLNVMTSTELAEMKRRELALAQANFLMEMGLDYQYIFDAEQIPQTRVQGPASLHGTYNSEFPQRKKLFRTTGVSEIQWQSISDPNYRLHAFHEHIKTELLKRGLGHSDDVCDSDDGYREKDREREIEETAARVLDIYHHNNKGSLSPRMLVPNRPRHDIQSRERGKERSRRRELRELSSSKPMKALLGESASVVPTTEQESSSSKLDRMRLVEEIRKKAAETSLPIWIPPELRGKLEGNISPRIRPAVEEESRPAWMSIASTSPRPAPLPASSPTSSPSHITNDNVNNEMTSTRSTETMPNPTESLLKDLRYRNNLEDKLQSVPNTPAAPRQNMLSIFPIEHLITPLPSQKEKKAKSKQEIVREKLLERAKSLKYRESLSDTKVNPTFPRSETLLQGVIDIKSVLYKTGGTEFNINMKDTAVAEEERESQLYVDMYREHVRLSHPESQSPVPYLRAQIRRPSYSSTLDDELADKPRIDVINELTAKVNFVGQEFELPSSLSDYFSSKATKPLTPKPSGHHKNSINRHNKNVKI